jgi:hypothetical protein
VKREEDPTHLSTRVQGVVARAPRVRKQSMEEEV